MKHAVFVFAYQILILNFSLSSWVHTTYFHSVVQNDVSDVPGVTSSLRRYVL